MCYVYKSDMNHLQEKLWHQTDCTLYMIWHTSKSAAINLDYVTGNIKFTHLPTSETKILIWIVCPEVIEAWQVLIMCFTLDLLHQKKLVGKKRLFLRSYILKKI